MGTSAATTSGVERLIVEKDVAFQNGAGVEEHVSDLPALLGAVAQQRPAAPIIFDRGLHRIPRYWCAPVFC
jgi:hypothetical protein